MEQNLGIIEVIHRDSNSFQIPQAGGEGGRIPPGRTAVGLGGESEDNSHEVIPDQDLFEGIRDHLRLSNLVNFELF